MEGCGGGGASGGGNNYYNNMTSMGNMGFGDNNSSSSTSSGIGGLSSMAKLMLMTSPSSANGDTSNKNHLLPLPWSSTISNNNPNNNNNTLLSSINMRDKIMSHPHFPRLLAAYANCQKVGAPPEVVGRLEEACGSAEAMAMRAGASSSSTTSSLGEDPALDQFMEAYCEMLTKYHQELTKPFKEAMIFLSTIESQFKALTLDHHHHLHNGNNIVYSSDVHVSAGRNGSSSEEADGSDNFIDPQAEDKELKGQLLRRYSGYLGSLKQDFLKKKKKGKLPKEARQQLLEWWSRHYKWPYPSEAQKLALAESTGLDQKQINNWFINQRKRHWKPSEDMQLVVMDAAHNPHYFMDTVMGNPYPMDFMPTPTLL